MSLQSQYVIGLHRDENPTKSRCCHNIVCPLGKDCFDKHGYNFDDVSKNGYSRSS